MTHVDQSDDAARLQAIEDPEPIRSWYRSRRDAAASVEKANAEISRIWRGLRSVDVQRACEDIRRVTPFLAALLLVPRGAHAEAVKDADYCAAMRDIATAAAEVHAALLAVKLGEDLHHIVVEKSAVVRARSEATRSALRAVIDTADLTVLTDIERAKALALVETGAVEAFVRDLAEQSRASALVAARAAEEARSSADTAAVTGGRAKSEALAEHFATYAITEGRTADRYQQVAIGLVALISVGAVAFFAFLREVTVTELALKLTFAVPLAVLAGYLIGESAQHRKSARWSAELAVKLRSLNAYTAGLEPAEQLEYRGLLGKGIFGASPAPGADVPDPGLTDAVIAELDKLVDLSARVRGLFRPDGGPS